MIRRRTWARIAIANPHFQEAIESILYTRTS